MDCKFKILTKDEKTYIKLKKYADGWSKKGLIIIEKNCDFFDFLKKFDIEMLITPFSFEGNLDCFYYDGIMKDCNKEILKKFDTQNYEPIEWGMIDVDDIPF